MLSYYLDISVVFVVAVFVVVVNTSKSTPSCSPLITSTSTRTSGRIQPNRFQNGHQKRQLSLYLRMKLGRITNSMSIPMFLRARNLNMSLITYKIKKIDVLGGHFENCHCGHSILVVVVCSFRAMKGHEAGAYPGFCDIKRTNGFHHPRDRMSVCRRTLSQ